MQMVFLFLICIFMNINENFIVIVEKSLKSIERCI